MCRWRHPTVNIFFFLPRGPMLPSLHFRCASIAAKQLRERTAGRERGEQKKRSRRRSSGERKRRRGGIPAHKDAEMQSVPAPLRAQNAHVPFQLQTRDATEKKTKRPLVGGDNYRAGLDKRSRTAGAEAQNNPSQQATNWERSRRPCSNSTPLSSSSVHVIFTEGFKSRPWLHFAVCLGINKRSPACWQLPPSLLDCNCTEH